MKADPNAGAPAAPNSKKKLMLIVIMAVLVLGLGGGAAWFFTRSSGDGKAETKHKVDKSAPPVYVTLEPFTVNLQPETGDQYLQLQCTLQVANAEQEELLKANMPKVSSRILLLLSSKKASEINTVAGKKKLSEEIVSSVKQPFVDKGEPQEVTDVLFTSFIIQ